MNNTSNKTKVYSLQDAFDSEAALVEISVRVKYGDLLVSRNLCCRFNSVLR